MAQYQLLLLALCGAIATLATAAGIEAYEHGQRRAAADRMTQTALNIAIAVQRHAKAPSPLRSDAPESEALTADFSDLSKYEAAGGAEGATYTRQDARYSLDGPEALPDGYTASACPEGERVHAVHAYHEAHDVSVCVAIAGPAGEDLTAGQTQ